MSGYNDFSASVQVDTNTPPAADCSVSDTEIDAGNQTLFDGTGSNDPDGPITSYSWNFDDGSSVTGSDSVWHTYEDPGRYTASLTVGDGDATDSTRCREVRVNGAPNAGNDSYSTPQDTDLIPVSNHPLSNDTDPNRGDELTPTIISGPDHGSVPGGIDKNGNMEYRPNDGFSGTDQFTYRVTDEYDASDTATVTIRVIDTTGQININVQDTSGNPVSGASGGASYNGSVCGLGGGSSVSCSVQLFNDPTPVTLNCSDLNPPSGYRCKGVRDATQYISY